MSNVMSSKRRHVALCKEECHISTQSNMHCLSVARINRGSSTIFIYAHKHTHTWTDTQAHTHYMLYRYNFTEKALLSIRVDLF